MRRREFVTLLGGAAAAWPLAASAQQPAMQVVGMLNPQSLRASGHLIDAFRRVFTETGYVEGQNVAIEYHFSEGSVDRLAEMAADLIRRQVSVMAAPGTVPARVAIAATHTIPIVFGVSEDPVKLGLVASLAHPGGNATGINSFSSEVNGKRLGLLRELLPRAARVAVLVNPANTTNTSSVLADVEPAARALGLQLQIYNASTSGEIDAAFAALVRERPDALFLASDGLFSTRRLAGGVPVPYRPVMLIPPLAPLLAQVPPMIQAILPVETGVMANCAPKPIITSVALTVPAGSGPATLITGNNPGGSRSDQPPHQSLWSTCRQVLVCPVCVDGS